MTSAHLRNRQSSGQPTGGQFATEAKGTATGVSLGGVAEETPWYENLPDGEKIELARASAGDRAGLVQIDASGDLVVSTRTPSKGGWERFREVERVEKPDWVDPGSWPATSDAASAWLAGNLARISAIEPDTPEDAPKPSPETTEAVQDPLFRTGAGAETKARRKRELREKETARLAHEFERQNDLLDKTSGLARSLPEDHVEPGHETFAFLPVEVDDGVGLLVEIDCADEPATTTSLVTAPGTLGVRTRLVKIDDRGVPLRNDDRTLVTVGDYDPATCPRPMHDRVPPEVQELALWHDNLHRHGTAEQERTAAEYDTVAERLTHVGPDEGHRYASEPLYAPVPTKVLRAAFKVLSRP